MTVARSLWRGVPIHKGAPFEMVRMGPTAALPILQFATFPAVSRMSRGLES